MATFTFNFRGTTKTFEGDTPMDVYGPANDWMYATFPQDQWDDFYAWMDSTDPHTFNATFGGTWD